jgi:uncharacterized membrane protein YdbT with pleckstrin-like domain
MAEIMIRPTLRFLIAGYIATAIVVIAAEWALSYAKDLPSWSIVFPLLLFIWPLKRHVHRQLTKMTMLDDKLRYESGFLSKVTRTIQLSKVQDVTVHQTLGQRLAGVGDLSIETAGEASRLTVTSIEQPQHIADGIIEASQREAAKGRGPAPSPGPQGQGQQA